jgi:hypothetical protein
MVLLDINFNSDSYKRINNMPEKLKIKFVPYERFRRDGYKSFIKDVREDAIILIDAKLKAEEEASVIQETMKRVAVGFPGIELNSLELPEADAVAEKIKGALLERVTGKKRGFTIIGPSKIVREIRKKPEELMLYTL